MGKTRYDRLHKPSRVALAEQIALFALDIEEQTGKSVIYMTKWDIAQKLDADIGLLSQALSLASTAEFLEKYGYGFICPGNGRSGEKYGYVLQHDRAQSATGEASDNLDDTDRKLADHLRGSAGHWKMIQVAHGGNTKVGKAAARIVEILVGAAAMVEGALAEGDE